MKVVDELADSRGVLPPSEVSTAACGAAPRQTTRTAAIVDSKLVYCRRCGQEAGKQSICTGAHTHHEFFLGSCGAPSLSR